LPFMAKKSKRGGWLLRHDRELIVLAKTHSLQDIADKFDRSVAMILKRAKRLGLSIRATWETLSVERRTSSYKRRNFMPAREGKSSHSEHGPLVAEEANERRPLTPAERKTRNAARQVEAEKAMVDHEQGQKAFHENRARLKAERLTREASDAGLRAKK
jgi:hypothetical protein